VPGLASRSSPASASFGLSELQDFCIYRRSGREVIPLIHPPA